MISVSRNCVTLGTQLRDTSCGESVNGFTPVYSLEGKFRGYVKDKFIWPDDQPNRSHFFPNE